VTRPDDEPQEHEPAGRGSGESRNATTAKTVLTDTGAVDLAVPRDRAGSFDWQIVRKGQTRLAGFKARIITGCLRFSSICRRLRDKRRSPTPRATIGKC